jgi:hypothetical protein
MPPDCGGKWLDLKGSARGRTKPGGSDQQEMGWTAITFGRLFSYSVAIRASSSALESRPYLYLAWHGELR